MYGPPQGQQQQMVPQPAYGQAPMQPGAGGATVLGQPLEPGERVIWFRKHSYTLEKIIMIVLGVFLLVIIIGIGIIIYGVLLERWKPVAHVVTNRRLIVFGAPGKPPESYPLAHIADINPIRKSATSGGGGLIGMAISAGINAAANALANQNHKLTKDFWNRTEALDITFSNGQKVRVKLDTEYGPQLGLTLARAVFNREAETMPNAEGVLP
jgi:hypothetical protein